MEEYHIPVLLNESKEFLINNYSGVYFDGTLGFGGHSSEFLKILDDKAKIVATEVDNSAFQYCLEKFSNENRIKILNTNFSQIDIASKIEFVDKFDGIFADLGVSSFQLDEPGAGFSYRSDAQLDLRMDKKISVTASDIVNSFSSEDLAEIFFKYGEEKNSRRIAQKIVERRESKKIISTKDLSKIIEEVTPQNFLNKTLSRVFQALRIFINRELDVLKEFLQKSVELLKTGGSLVIISYHSLEDRIVKEFFKYENLKCVCPPEFPICTCGKVQRLDILTRKPVTPDQSELIRNPRARSAKLRAARRI
jgi:16S rRNA (cytosine1402-N4)-methyltransferase